MLISYKYMKYYCTITLDKQSFLNFYSIFSSRNMIAAVLIKGVSALYEGNWPPLLTYCVT